MGSLILRAADETRVEAGGALAVDRQGFADYVTRAIRSHPRIAVTEEEVTSLPREGDVIVATGPLTSDALADHLLSRLGGESAALHFFDAAAPLVTFESIDMSRAWFASRYDKGTADYVNCALEKEEYQAFWQALCEAEEAEVHGFEDRSVFEGCMPVEVMARRGDDGGDQGLSSVGRNVVQQRGDPGGFSVRAPTWLRGQRLLPEPGRGHDFPGRTEAYGLCGPAGEH